MAERSKNFGAAAVDYRRHRVGFPDKLFDRLVSFGVGLADQNVVDLGTGTGSLARGFSRRGCIVTAIDPDERMVEQAKVLDREAGVEIDYRIATAEATGLGSGSAHVVTAGQCWHWFNGPAAAQETFRLLVTGGRAVIVHFDWVEMCGNVVEATKKLIGQHNPKWTYRGEFGLHGYVLRDLGEAGFQDLETFSFDLLVPYNHESWRGRIRASAGVAASLGEDAVRGFDEALKSMLENQFPGTDLQVPHRFFSIIASRGHTELSD